MSTAVGSLAQSQDVATAPNHGVAVALDQGALQNTHVDSASGPSLSSSTTSSPPSSSEPTRYTNQRTEQHTSDIVGKMRTLFEIVQNRELTVAEKNLRFVQAFGRMQIAAFKNMVWREEFSTDALQLKMCSVNTMRENNTNPIPALPFFMLHPASEIEPTLQAQCGLTKPASEITSSYNGTRIDFRAVVLPDALKAEINQEDIVKQKAGVSEVRTLQEWAHGTAYRYSTVQVQTPMPDMSCPAHAAVTLVPVMSTETARIGLWDPFFKAAAGVKLMLTYGNDATSPAAIGGGSAYVTDDNFTIVQDSPVKKQHWKVDRIAVEEGETAATVAKIKQAAINVAIIPCSSVGSTSFSPSATQKLEPEQAVHMHIRAIPIDISEITTEAGLETYLIALERLIIGLATPHAPVASSLLQQQSQQGLAASVASQNGAREANPSAQRTGQSALAPATLAEKLTQQVTRQAEWHRKFWGNLFSN